jgi:hypothetical protein
MQMKISLHAEELAFAKDHPLNDHIVSVFAWRYENPAIPSSGAHLTVQSIRRRRKGEAKAISITDKPFQSNEQFHLICHAMNTRNAPSLWELIQPLLPKPRSPKPTP